MYIQWFIEHDWTVITVLRPGYGRTRNALAGHGGDSEAALCRLLDDLKVASATVVGISAGDRAAMRFVELYPERVDRLLLVSLASWPSTPMCIAVHILIQSADRKRNVSANTMATAPLPRSKLEAADRTPHHIAN